MDPALPRMDGSEAALEAQQQVLSIEQIRCIRANNDYVDRPVALEISTQSGTFYNAHNNEHHHHHLHNHHNNHHHHHHHHHPHLQSQHSSGSSGGGGGYPHPVQPLTHGAPPAHMPRSVSGHQQHASHLSRSSTVSSSMSRGSAASDTRLLAGMTPSHSLGLASVSASMAVVSAQPTKGGGGCGGGGGCDPPQKTKEPSDGLSKGGKGDLSGSGEDHLGLHLFICERCGRCKCDECVTPRVLPSCWACGQRCLCSMESVVEYGTCLCCVKGLFYHCSAEDDEDSCADRPCSCTSAHGCARWSTMALLVPFLPCLCCYPPAKLCLALCQRGYDRATRPGCRCRNTNTVCRKISSAAAAAAAAAATTNQPPPFQKCLEKPA